MDTFIEAYYESKDDQFVRYSRSVIHDSCGNRHDRHPFIETHKRS